MNYRLLDAQIERHHQHNFAALHVVEHVGVAKGAA
jgi:hypothetical protein